MKITPMMRQYLDAKQGHEDAILLFRMGDFYEMFFDDAETAARECGLTLTARHKGEAHETPMAGIPHHAAEGYIAKLVAKGYKVAVCDQLEAPQKGKKIVRRGVTRVITPGVVTDPELLEEKANNYLAAVCVGLGRSIQTYGLAYVDASTGDFKVTELTTFDQLAAELSRIEPREIVTPEDQAEIFEPLRKRPGLGPISPVNPASFQRDLVLDAIRQGDTLNSDLMADAYFVDPDTAAGYFKTLDKGRYRDKSAMERAMAGVLAYLIYTQRGVGAHIRNVEPYSVDDYLIIDDSTRANLELTETLMGGRRKGSLLHTIDTTVTAMGGRRLRSWLAYPLVDTRRIVRRLDAVEELHNSQGLRDGVRTRLKATYDIERLTSKLASGSANARDLVQLRDTLTTVPALSEALTGVSAGLLRIIGERLDPCEDLCALLDRAIVDDPPAGLRDGGLFKPGYHDELDELIDLCDNGKDWILRYEADQRQRTGISSLKVKFNKVFGYFLEVTKANLHLVPDDFMRKQTLANSERYITPELNEYEEKILTAEDTRKTLEYNLFEDLRAEIGAYVHRLRHVAYLISTLDVLAALAETAHAYNYCRPTVDQSDTLRIRDGRHPVVERHLVDERFVPNSVHLDNTRHQLLLITGPNMAGKSTVIRQVAVIALMAQMGSFVPAAEAHIGVVDKIFSRVGASDNLVKGQSTFMVEMTETAHILRNATERSLIILDEIGRGTSTYDGLSIAWAVTEHLHDQVGAKTLFATHYHELTTLADALQGVENFNIAVKEHRDDIVFLRKLIAGPANRSYGIQVGRLAGIPQQVVDRAKVVLKNLEDADQATGIQALAATRAPSKNAPQLSLLGAAGTPDAVTTASEADARPLPRPAAPAAPPTPALTDAQKSALDALDLLDISTTTPLEALNLIYSLKQKLKAEREASA